MMSFNLCGEFIWIPFIITNSFSDLCSYYYFFPHLGQYVYLANSEKTPGLIASLLIKNEYPASNGVCFIRLWYYMHTDTLSDDSVISIGVFRVYLLSKFYRLHLFIAFLSSFTALQCFVVPNLLFLSLLSSLSIFLSLPCFLFLELFFSFFLLCVSVVDKDKKKKKKTSSNYKSHTYLFCS